MYGNRIKSSFLESFGRIRRIDAVTEEVKIKREKFEKEYVLEQDKNHNKKIYMRDKHVTYGHTRFFPPVEIYLDGINNHKVLINKLSIPWHKAYQLKEDSLGKNFDKGI